MQTMKLSLTLEQMINSYSKPICSFGCFWMQKVLLAQGLLICLNKYIFKYLFVCLFIYLFIYLPYYTWF